MGAVGIIVEYNPFHYGHEFHIKEARRLSQQEDVIAVMSGSFVQRGEPAIIDKWYRAHMAIASGVDLVLELPIVFSLRSAQYFSAGAIKLLQALGCVSHICFGAEETQLTKLMQAAQLTNKPETIASLKLRMRQTGRSYASILTEMIQSVTGAKLSPNNILAIEYLRALHDFAPQLAPLLVNRQGAAYHDKTLSKPCASATAIRKAIVDEVPFSSIKAAMPVATFDLLQQGLQHQQGPATLNALAKPIVTSLRQCSLDELALQAEMIEGIHHKIKRAALAATDWNSLLAGIVSKRYAPAKIKRILLYTLLHVTNKELLAFDESGPLYARVLAFNERGRALLKKMEQSSSLPAIVKTAHFLNSHSLDKPQSPLEKMLALDIHASNLHGLCLPTNHWQPGNQDFIRSPLYIH
ncbi:putative nucleotidyltransferase [Sporomusaceae bacterium BoRhaA]|uniref:nucleotidyltransferase n=1 Tax=Pelorhabdus rhamnosifermentans TaxID=2772457 RepID=UPI001C06004F|nr:nucleotidyltransferase [Pelorhabdus rhamnosifermentans]MBU2701201.1 putative nucleotidyltransferase [Pelorhabdus rhamnosifermentans]